MSMTMRVSLPGYDALTDGTIDHYSLYADSNNILIKEYQRGTITVSPGSTGTVSHNFGYVPFYMAYCNTGSDRAWVYGVGIFSLFESYANTASIYFYNGDAGDRSFYYYIFYDEQV